MSHEAICEFLANEFPQVFAEEDISVDEAGSGTARLTLRPGDKHLRPGGVISGPTLMLLADAGAYAALLSLDASAKMAVTSNLSISFLKGAPPGAAIVQTARVIRPGRRLCVIVAEAFGEGGGDEPLAHATMTYAMPLGASGIWLPDA